MSVVLIVRLIFYLFGVVYTVAVYIYNMGNRDLPDIVWRVIFEGNLFSDILKNPSSSKVNLW